MTNHPILKSKVMIKFANDAEINSRGKELRKEGYKLHWHPIWGHSVEIPSGEHLYETQIKVRYHNSNNKRELENAFEYLTLCKETLCKINGLEFKLS
ncbi:hypothetical protein KAT36_01860 [Candidatus Pacearchaeota archaeon]|nr:hypothetical protein [Candidatus Pacearchaeota archaeon]